MKILVAGYPKTGTKTLKCALNTLGYDNIYDVEHHFFHLGKEWTKVFTEGGTKEDFYNMYKDVDVALDAPVCVFWQDILKAFPDVKIILMERDEDEWFRSLDHQNRKIRDNVIVGIMAFLSPTAFSFRKYGNHLGRVTFSMPEQDFGRVGSLVSKNVAVQRFRDHNAGVLMRAPPKQLLKFDVKDGWGPICKFLEKPVPEEPFPHKNKVAGVIEEYMKTNPVFIKMFQEMKISFALIVVCIAVGVYLLFSG